MKKSNNGSHNEVRGTADESQQTEFCSVLLALFFICSQLREVKKVR